MIVIAGGIGSGKSVVSRILRLRSFGVYDCDFHARRLMETEPRLIRIIKELAGDDVYDSSQRLKRIELASRIFSNPIMRENLNNRIHQAVIRDIEIWLKSNPSHIFVETAIAAQSGLANMANAIWLVRAPHGEKKRRIKIRDGRDENQIDNIMKVQEAEEREILSKDIQVWIINNDSHTPLIPQIEQLLKLQI